MTTRRDFLKGTGSLVVYFGMSSLLAAAGRTAFPRVPGSLAENPQLDSWIRIHADGSVTIYTGKSELGQGIQTALAQIAAEELDVAVERIGMAPVDTDHSPDEAYTFSSISVQQSGGALRVAAAEARQILLERAAGALRVDMDRLGVADGRFLIDGEPSGLDYWSVLGDRPFSHTATGEVTPKSPDSYRIVGTSVKRLDIPPKVFGEAIYVQDLRLPNMLHARMVRPQRQGAELLEVNGLSAIGTMPGVVKVIRDGSFLAVVAGREEQALQAAENLEKRCRWGTPSPLPDENELTAWLYEAPADVTVVNKQGVPDSTISVRRLSAGYSRPYQAHGSLSPSAAVALKDSSGLTVWSHSQGVYPLRGAISRVTGVAENQVRCIHVQAAGCYGHNGADDAACDAAVIAVQVPGYPVRLQWSRRDEFLFEPYGSAMAMRVDAGLDKNGRIVDWQYDVWSTPHSSRPGGAGGAGNLLAAREVAKNIPAAPLVNIPQPKGGADRNAIPLYSFPNQTVTKHFVTDVALRVSALRALGAYGNVFAIESFMDELAQLAGDDPLEFRIRHLQDKRAVAVLEKLGEITNWPGPRETSASRGQGLAFAQYKNQAAYCAVAMCVQLDKRTGDIRLDRAVGVVDAGRIINPDGVRNQIEGGMIQSASWTLKEQVRFSQEKVNSRDWISYPVLKFDEVPITEVALIDHPELPPLGVGEAAQGPTAAAIANAVARATGIRLRDLPFTAVRLRTALSQ